MALILNIETSGDICSVCLSDEGKVQFLKESDEGRNHASELAVLIQQVLEEANIDAQNLDAIAVSQGPGSYTGLRIGVSTTKGICYAAQKPMLAVPTLQAMAMGFVQKHQIDETDLLCPMIDARRMEVYSALFDNKGHQMLREVKAEIIDNNSYTNELQNNKIHFFGSGAEKCREALQHPNARIYADFKNSSAFMVTLASKLYQKGTFVDVAYFEPFYLKEFVATTPKNKVF
jgi:tRNA threonylcarbamoyladenosine biosynthesis protein TsaB